MDNTIIKQVAIFRGIDVFNKQFIEALKRRYKDYKEVNFHTKEDTLQIKIKIEDLANPNHALRQTLKLYPDKEVLITTGSIVEEFYDINDIFVNDYVLIANSWAFQNKAMILEDDYIPVETNKYLCKNLAVN